MFVFEPSLLMDGAPGEIIISILTALIGVIILAAGVIGWLITKATIVERIALIAGGLLTIYPGLLSDGIGVVLIISILFIQRRREIKIIKIDRRRPMEKRGLKGTDSIGVES